MKYHVMLLMYNPCIMMRCYLWKTSGFCVLSMLPGFNVNVDAVIV